VVMQEEKLKLQEEAEKLAQQLQAVLNDKFVRRNTFDAETPIDKTLKYLETIISVSLPFQWPAVLIVAAPSFLLRSAQQLGCSCTNALSVQTQRSCAQKPSSPLDRKPGVQPQNMA